MSKQITIPHDRTSKHPTLGYCKNPQCREKQGQEFYFVVEDDYFCCPKCKADRSPMIGTIVMTHYLIQHASGPIIGRGGIHFQFACDQARAYLATASNEEAATGEIASVTCKGCLEVMNGVVSKSTDRKARALKRDLKRNRFNNPRIWTPPKKQGIKTNDS